MVPALQKERVSQTTAGSEIFSCHQVLISSVIILFHSKDTEGQVIYRGADKSLAQPGRKQATATEDFDVHISYLLSWRNISTYI